MVPMRTSSIFKSRWMALIWAAGIIWFALDVAGGSDAPAANASANETGITDATGQPVTSGDAAKVANSLGL